MRVSTHFLNLLCVEDVSTCILNCDVKFVFYYVSWSKKFESHWSRQWLHGVMSCVITVTAGCKFTTVLSVEVSGDLTP